ncbi:uncharacterized protein LOC130015694 [Mercurialis annua]|uniref:uncharacterized protein LOC130015694 n=1 Tax=Mercurialis annua TaxID=3986 RepID=UPI0024ADA229|nr:uncharacterized protein LOC130015694 [Mercurialis annua]
MLAKQAWKLVQEPRSLCARVLKAKYYPLSDFYHSTRRRGSSYLWQSIMSGKRVLDSGTAWRVGNGETIDAIKDKWITSASFMKPVGYSNIPTDCRVCYFLNDGGGWDERKLAACFSPEDVVNVLKLPISRNLPPDKLFWTPEKRGLYTVKSGYYQACKLLNMGSASSSSGTVSNGLWPKIWRRSFQPKHRHFLWRILHEALPCNVKLSIRVPEVSKTCPRCGVEDETQLHALKECEAVRGLWLLSPLSLRGDLIMCRNMEEWLVQSFNLFKEDKLQLFVLSLWTIWCDRNNLVFGNRRQPPDEMFRYVIPSNCDSSASDRVSKALTPAANHQWIPPDARSVKLNSDAAISLAKNCSVISAVCRNSHGTVLRWGVKFLHGITDAESAESQAVLFGLHIASDIYGERLICESDAANVINRLLHPSHAIDPIQLVIDDCISLAAARNVSFIHVRRQCNQFAHALAKWGIFSEKIVSLTVKFLFRSMNLLIVLFD